ncbi:unnamed protein product [Amoebophrya sp. A25]|nr:unnamed protein product [Amoebophrya sp. A25]|eukprot:GSA25T00015390001.1
MHHRNQELCHDVRQKCSQPLANECSAERIMQHNAMNFHQRRLEAESGESSAGSAVLSQQGTNPTTSLSQEKPTTSQGSDAAASSFVEGSAGPVSTASSASSAGATSATSTGASAPASSTGASSATSTGTSSATSTGASPATGVEAASATSDSMGATGSVSGVEVKNKLVADQAQASSPASASSPSTAASVLGQSRLSANTTREDEGQPYKWVAWPLQRECLRKLPKSKVGDECRAALFHADMRTASSGFFRNNLRSLSHDKDSIDDHDGEDDIKELYEDYNDFDYEDENYNNGDENDINKNYNKGENNIDENNNNADKDDINKNYNSQDDIFHKNFEKTRYNENPGAGASRRTQDITGSSTLTATPNAQQTPSASQGDRSLDMHPLLAARCSEDLKRRCSFWSNKLQCLQMMMNRDVRAQAAEFHAIKMGNSTSPNLGWFSKSQMRTSGQSSALSTNQTRNLWDGFMTIFSAARHGSNNEVDIFTPKKTWMSPHRGGRSLAETSPVSTTAAHAGDDEGSVASKEGRATSLAYKPKRGFKPQFEMMLSDACRAQVRTTLRSQLADVRLNPEIGTKCKGDIDILCSAAFKQTEASNLASGQTMHCLRQRYFEIQSQDCVDVFRTAMETFQLDWASDTVTKQACKADRQLFCPFLKPFLVHQCLQEHIDELGVECQKQEFMVSTVAQIDPKSFNPYLSRMCLLDMDRFCPDDGTNDRSLTCLRKVPPTSLHTSCSVAMRNNELRTGQDYRLKFGVTNACDHEMHKYCKTEVALAKPEGKVLQCLIQNKDTIQTQARQQGGALDGNIKCAEEVVALATQMARNVGAGRVIKLACAEDIKQKCATITPGSGAIHDCLVDNLSSLSEECAKEEMALQSALAGRLAGHPTLQSCCESDAQKLCSVPDEEGKRIACLVKKRKEASWRCRQCLQRHVKRQNRDFRLNPVLKKECAPDIKEHCKKAEADQKLLPGTGQVIQAKSSPGCFKAVQMKIRQRADDYRVAPFFHTSCEEDVLRFCKDVKPGSGRVHTCLQKNFSLLTPQCKALEFRSQIETDPGNDPQIRLYCKSAFEKPGSKCFLSSKENRLYQCLDRIREDTEVINKDCLQAIQRLGAKRGRSMYFNRQVLNRCQADLAHFVSSGKCEGGTLPLSPLEQKAPPLVRSLDGSRSSVDDDQALLEQDQSLGYHDKEGDEVDEDIALRLTFGDDEVLHKRIRSRSIQATGPTAPINPARSSTSPTQAAEVRTAALQKLGGTSPIVTKVGKTFQVDLSADVSG